MVSEACRKLLQKTGATSIIYADMAEWFKAAVLKTVEGNSSLGSNPSVRASVCKIFRLNSDGLTKILVASVPLTKASG